LRTIKSAGVSSDCLFSARALEVLSRSGTSFPLTQPSGEDRLLDGNLNCDSLLIDLPANEPT
jgi:hypothetical protein